MSQRDMWTQEGTACEDTGDRLDVAYTSAGECAPLETDKGGLAKTSEARAGVSGSISDEAVITFPRTHHNHCPNHLPCSPAAHIQRLGGVSRGKGTA